MFTCTFCTAPHFDLKQFSSMSEFSRHKKKLRLHGHFEQIFCDMHEIQTIRPVLNCCVLFFGFVYAHECPHFSSIFQLIFIYLHFYSATIQAISAYLDAFQKIADAATNSRGKNYNFSIYTRYIKQDFSSSFFLCCCKN